jgi:succinate-acetate transporter protein
MTIHETTTPTAPVHDGERVAVEEEAQTGPLIGNPLLLGLPAFAAGSVAFGLSFIGYVPPAAQAGALPVIIAATGVGLLIATVWAIALGQSAVASVFGVFAGFWLSYATLVLGLGHNWFGIPARDVTHTVAAFLIVWLAIIGLLTLALLRLPFAFELVLLLVDAALVLILIGTINTSPNLDKAGGWVALVFAAVGGYLFTGASSVVTGGKPLPLGRPILK